jgi:hypothetical protein
MNKEERIKDLEYYKNNCEENYKQTPISVLRYIERLESKVLELQKEVERLKAMDVILEEINNIMWEGFMVKSKGFIKNDGARIMNELEKWASIEPPKN